MPAAEVKMNVKQFARYQLYLAQNFIPAALRGIYSGTLACVPRLQEATRRAPPANPAGKGSGGAVNTGAFLQAWRASRLPEGAVVSNNKPYAGVIEGGRRPGKSPPPKEIAKWAQRRLGLSPEQAKGAAFAIARAIGKRGLKARKVMGNELKDMTEIVEREMMHEFDAELAK